MAGMYPLIEAEELKRILDRVVIVDIRWALTDPEQGRVTYLNGHIPGAVFADLDEDLSGPPGLDGRHPLPDPGAFAATLGRLGIEPETHVITYDDTGGVVAARLWWMLQAIGHEKAQLLNGGYQAWIGAGYEVETGPVDPEPTSYPTPDGFSGTVDRFTLEGRTLVDARAPERYRGEIEPVDPKAGHIPGAINRPTTTNLGPDGRFLHADQLFDIYRGLTDPVVYCGSGVNACHDIVAMVAAGLPTPDLYPGSFSEWSRRDLPVEVGE